MNTSKLPEASRAGSDALGTDSRLTARPNRLKTSTVDAWIVKIRELSATGIPTATSDKGEPSASREYRPRCGQDSRPSRAADSRPSTGRSEPDIPWSRPGRLAGSG